LQNNEFWATASQIASKLTSLSLASNQVTDEGLAQLKLLGSLRELTLFKVRLTDNGLAHLAELKNLESLSVLSFDVSENALKNLNKLTDLTRLSIAGSLPTDRVLESIRPLEKLERLSLGDLNHESHITSSGLKSLRDLTKLRILSVSGNFGVSDDGLIHLYRLKTLKFLSMYSTSVSERGVKRLKLALPNCDVSWSNDKVGFELP